MACLLQGPALLSACHMLLKRRALALQITHCIVCHGLSDPLLASNSHWPTAQACNISGIDTLCCTATLRIGQPSCTGIICWPAGNSPWPIGVTSIDIHDRTSREKISHVMNGAAHVMNDEATRKYLQVSLTVGLWTGRSCSHSDLTSVTSRPLYTSRGQPASAGAAVLVVLLSTWTAQPSRVTFSLPLHASWLCTRWGRVAQSNSSEVHSLLQEAVCAALHIISQTTSMPCRRSKGS